MRARPKPNATPTDLAFGVTAVAVAIGQGYVRSLNYHEESSNPRVLALVEAAGAQGIPTNAVDLRRLDQLAAGGVHQGILVRLKTLSTADLRALEQDRTAPALAILLDGVTDPQNLGAILRTAVAVGAGAVVLPKRRGGNLTPGVHRASAGISFLAPVTTPQNLAMAIRDLKKQDFWVVAAASDGAELATEFEWPRRTALVVGGEQEGVSRLLRDLSDFTVALPMDQRVESLNVGVAFGALAYLWRAQWPKLTTRGDAI